MTTQQVIAEIKKAGSEQIKKIYQAHGGKEPFYGVKIQDLKLIQKKIKENQQEIALELFDSGIYDAQYLAGLMAHGSKMTVKQLQTWASNANGPGISDYSVPWVTSENEKGFEIGLKWIDSKNPDIACSGWNTLSSVVSMRPDDKLDIPVLKKLLARVEKEIDKAPNRVRYCMNGFVIATGAYVKELTPLATATGKKIGHVEVDMGKTACKVPFAPDYIKKSIEKGSHTKKKKTCKC
jgi:3-methyladenine DNA glycosylase AlkD